VTQTPIDVSKYRKLRQKVIDAELNLKESIWFLRRAEVAAISKFVEENGGDWKVLGSNEQQRKATEIAILADSQDYTVFLSDQREAERTVAEAQADLDAYLEVRRVEREQIQKNMAEALKTSNPIVGS